MTRDQEVTIENFMATSRKVTMTLGDEFVCEGETLRFIRVTDKGFNLLWVEGHRTILKHHMYAIGWGGQSIPYNKKKFHFYVSPYVHRFLKDKKLPDNT